MKTPIIALVSLLAGIGVGWYVGSRPNADVARENRDVRQTINDIGNVEESYSAGAASISVSAVQAIDSGKTDEAVQWLSFPISTYYRDYGNRDHAGTNAQRVKLASRIEQLARTNEVVRDRIKKVEGPSWVLDRVERQKEP
jgi:hypothetical protein